MIPEPEGNDDDRHKERMARKKASRERLMARRTETRGLILVHTGPGKGKTTAALGMVLRCAGHGLKAAVVQFIKGAKISGERLALERFSDLVSFDALGEGFTWGNPGPCPRRRRHPARLGTRAHLFGRPFRGPGRSR